VGTEHAGVAEADVLPRVLREALETLKKNAARNPNERTILGTTNGPRDLSRGPFRFIIAR